MKGIGIGRSDFKSIITMDCYYIDKTMFIKHIIDNKNKIIVITRPRIFGKTLNLGMLKYYFDIKENSKELFKDLKIIQQDEYYISKLNYYPVIYLTLKDIQMSKYDDMILNLKWAIQDLYGKHMYLLESNKIYEDEKEKIKEILSQNEDEITLKNSIRDLSKYLNRYYGKQVILLIDEYDAPLQKSYVEKYYDEAIDFFKEFYNITFNDNSYIEKAVLMGVNRIAEKSIFSKIDNFNIYAMLNTEFAEDFGITEKELEKIISDFNIEENKEKLEKYYGKYKIGNVEEIYNLYSILNYLQNKELKTYWINVSEHKLIEIILKECSLIKEKIISLLNDEVIEVKIDLETPILENETKEEKVWELMLNAGFLKIVEKVDLTRYRVELVNIDAKEEFERLWERSQYKKDMNNPSELRKSNDKAANVK